ncbi:MAG: hypothetical protein NMNS01_06530 [Nitrosomonas sp.]|nr:MAG: hypothetical protein NMNS01_06530 [Nitrosomonas sp.]
MLLFLQSAVADSINIIKSVLTEADGLIVVNLARLKSLNMVVVPDLAATKQISRLHLDLFRIWQDSASWTTLNVP